MGVCYRGGYGTALRLVYLGSGSFGGPGGVVFGDDRVRMKVVRSSWWKSEREVYCRSLWPSNMVVWLEALDGDGVDICVGRGV